jgi:hypothetical protein
VIFITKGLRPNLGMPLQTFALLLLLAPTTPLMAQRVQSPDAPWRTLRTTHYRIHYPARGGFEPFALEVASKIEGIHSRVAEWVGYESPKVVEVLIRDPVREANGYAMTLLSHPFVVLWRTPPEADSGIAHVTTWAELLVTHELTHIHHLVRPQNRPNLLDKLLDRPVGPLARKTPRWMSEGYATVIEGKITGRGRPHSAYRASVIRQWALEGKLPDYGRLSATEGFRGGSMAYLIGSAYLEWLEARTSQEPEILKKLWKQLASSKRRGFEPSFKATFGFAAQDGYDRWRAEVTRDALELERRAKAEGWLQEGEIFTKVDGEVSDLAVSPDGTRLLARVLTRNFRGLQVWDLTQQDPHAGTRKPRPEMKPDPQEAVDARPVVPERKAAWTLGRVDNAVPRRAAWDGERVRFELRLPNGEGVLEPTFRSWKPGSGQVEQAAALPERAVDVQERHGLWTILQDGRPVVRTLSAAWNPAPAHDGKSLYYTQLSATGVEIRRIDLSKASAERPPLTDPAPLTAAAVLPPGDQPNTLPAPALPPVPAGYDAWHGLWNGSRFGAGLTPSGRAYQLGYGGSDLLGRASWQLLAGFGDAAGPRGAAFGIAWRGWRWAPALELFSSLERPSRQDWVAQPNLDRERRGAELSFTFEHRGRWPFALRPSLALERTVWMGTEESVQRRIAGLTAEFRRSWRPAENWAFEGRAKARFLEGWSEDRSWNLSRVEVRLLLTPPRAFPPLALEAAGGRLGGDSSRRPDGFHLGGVGTSLVPESLDAGRIIQAALPDHLQRGDRFQRGRVSLGQVLRGYWEAAVVWDSAAPRPAAQRVAGVEIALDELLRGELFAPLLGRMQFTAGLHRILQDAPGGQSLKDKLVATLSVVIRP